MAKLELKFSGMEAYLEQLNRLGANVKEEAEKALIESGEIVSQELHEQMKKHHVTGETESSIIEPKVEWKGTKASMRYGFDYKKGGEPALYLEKGRPHQKPTPVIKPAIEASEDKVKAAQEAALARAIERAQQ